MSRPFRLAVVANRPQPYHSGFFRELASHPRIDLVVYYLSDVGVGATTDRDFGRYRWDYAVLDGYRSRFLRNRSLWPGRSPFLSSFHPELFSLLHPRFLDAVLIHGWYGLSVWIAHFLCWRRGLPVLMRSDANAADLPRPGRQTVKKWLLTWLFRRCRAFLTVGTRNAEFYRRYGVPDEKMFFTPYAVDNDYFEKHRAALCSRRPELRRRLGVPAEAVVFLYAGRLAPVKRLGDLLQALHELDDPRTWLVLAGDGRSRRQLEKQAQSLGLDRILFAGFQTQEELARWYVAADVFVLPSEREPWGLVINEAMNCGLPLVVSERVGAVPDLVKPEENGLLFPPGDRAALRHCLRRLLNDPSQRAQLGERSRMRVRQWSHDGSSHAVVRALDFAATQRKA